MDARVTPTPRVQNQCGLYSGRANAPDRFLIAATGDDPSDGNSAETQEANAALIVRAVNSLASNEQKIEELTKALEAASAWFAKIHDDNEGVNYLNGDSDKYEGDGWEDAEAVAKQIDATLANARSGK